MLIFFDYLFYCYYRYCIRKDKLNAFFLSVLYVYFVIIFLLGFLVNEIMCILLHESYLRTFMVALYVLCYVRYRRKRDKIVTRFKGLKSNQILPIWIMPILVPCFMVVGFFLRYFFMKYVLGMPVEIVSKGGTVVGIGFE